MSPLCRANFSAEALRVIAVDDPKALQECIEHLSDHVEEIDPQDVMMTINEDRHVAGIPAVGDVSLVEAEIAEHVRRGTDDTLEARGHPQEGEMVETPA